MLEPSLPSVSHSILTFTSFVDNTETITPLLSDTNGTYKISIVGQSGSGEVLCTCVLPLLDHNDRPLCIRANDSHRRAIQTTRDSVSLAGLVLLEPWLGEDPPC